MPSLRPLPSCSAGTAAARANRVSPPPLRCHVQWSLHGFGDIDRYPLRQAAHAIKKASVARRRKQGRGGGSIRTRHAERHNGTTPGKNRDGKRQRKKCIQVRPLVRGTPPLLRESDVEAGLLALGSSSFARLPGQVTTSGKKGRGLADYSCGGSSGVRAHGSAPDSLLIPNGNLQRNSVYGWRPPLVNCAPDERQNRRVASRAA